jgi:hypothetical protein
MEHGRDPRLHVRVKLAEVAAVTVVGGARLRDHRTGQWRLIEPRSPALAVLLLRGDTDGDHHQGDSIVNDGDGSAGILVPNGGTGITINVGVNNAINLRGLIIEGAGFGLLGIRFNTGILGPSSPTGRRPEGDLSAPDQNDR